jgi:pullulanase
MGYMQTHGNVGRRWWRTASAWLAGVAMLAVPSFALPSTAQAAPGTPQTGTSAAGNGSAAGGSSVAAGAHDAANAKAGKDVIAIAFQENWKSVAKECTDVYGPEGIGYVEVSPATESIKGKQWWTSYQPVSYKLDSKQGTEQDFKNMVQTCRVAGVGVIADVVLNHMTGGTKGQKLEGVAGSTYQTDNEAATHTEDYPGVPYTSSDFHDCTKNISNYKDADEVRTCRLTRLRDLNTGSADVQEKEASYLAHLWDLGVAGYRVDGAKHMDPADLLAIKQKLATKTGVPMAQIPWTQEVIDNGGEAEALQPKYYYQTGRVTEFSFAYQLRQAFKGDVANLKNIAVDPDSHTSVDSAHADAFVANWDTERGSSTLSLADGRQYEMATAFTLADDYGQARIYSGYDVNNHDDGAPGATDTSVPDTVCPTQSAKTGWTCLERWTSVRGMVGFHNAVNGTKVADWQNPANGVIAFNRGNKGTFALNNNATAQKVTLTTQLPDGQYCDVYSAGDCSNTVTVSGGKAEVTLEPQAALAFYAGATKGSWKGTQKSDPTDPDFKVTVPDNDQTDGTTTVYYKLPQGQKTAYIHYGVNGTWTTAPGVKMNPACDGYVSADVDNQHAASIEAVFNDGNNSWDHLDGSDSKNYVLSGSFVTVKDHKSSLGNPCPIEYKPTTTLTVHYKPQNASDTRGVYVWGDKKDGGSLAGEHHAFTGSDSWGKVVTLTLPGAYENGKLGMIVTTPNWDKFGGDRHLDASNGSATVWIDGTNEADKDATPTAIPSSIAIKKLDVTVHYNRADADYADWDLWHWNASADGTASKFDSHDSFGVIAKYTETGDNITGSSIILRNGGDSWKGKDGQDNLAIPSSAIHVTDPEKGEAVAEVWISSSQRDSKNDPILYANGSVINFGHQVRSASATGMRTISVTLSSPLSSADPASAVTLEGADVKSVTADGAKLTITTTDDLDPSKLVSVAVKGYGTKKINVNMTPLVRTAAFDKKYDYDGKLGPQYSAGSTQFRLWAPTAAKVSLNTYASDRSADAKLKKSYAMTRGTKAGELGLWTVTLDGDIKDTAYDFTLDFADGTSNHSPDPYATAAVVNGERSVVLSPQETSIKDFNRMASFTGGPTAAVIGETSVRDLTNSESSGVSAKNRGKFLGVIEKGTKNAAGLPTGLDYLKKSGVTHVQFMPMYQFSSVDESKPDADQYNWGYDPKNYNVPEGWYSSDATNPAIRIIEMKQMVDGLHKAGLRVNMDVVYNHVYDASKQALGLTVPGYYFRYDANGALTNGSGCGNDVASERGMARKYIVDSVTYWAKNYNLDGFRFDLMGLLDQTTMNKVRASLDGIDKGILMYGEGWTMATGADASTLSDQQHADKVPGASFFDDALRDDVKGSVFDAHGKGFVSGKNNEADIARDMLACLSDSTKKGDACGDVSQKKHYVTPGQLLQYVEAHDNRTLYDTLAISMFGDPKNEDMPALTADQKAQVMKAVRLSNSVVALAQGMPFIQIGQSFGRTKGGNGNSYNASDTVNDINWDLETDNKSTEDYTSALLRLRQSIPALRMTSYADIVKNATVLQKSDGVVALSLADPSDSSKKTIIILNAGSKDVDSVRGIPAGTYSVLVRDGKVFGKSDARTLTIRSTSAVARALRRLTRCSATTSSEALAPAMSATVLQNVSTTPWTPLQPSKPAKPGTSIPWTPLTPAKPGESGQSGHAGDKGTAGSKGTNGSKKTNDSTSASSKKGAVNPLASTGASVRIVGIAAAVTLLVAAAIAVAVSIHRRKSGNQAANGSDAR